MCRGEGEKPQQGKDNMRRASAQCRDEKHMVHTVHSDLDRKSHKRKNACIYPWESWKRKRRKCLCKDWTARNVACGWSLCVPLSLRGGTLLQRRGVTDRGAEVSGPAGKSWKSLSSLTWPMCCLALSVHTVHTVHTEATDPPCRHIPNISELKQNFSYWNIEQRYSKSYHIGSHNARNAYVWQQCSLWRRAGNGRWGGD